MNNVWTHWGIKMAQVDRGILLADLKKKAEIIWLELCEIHPTLLKFDCPEIKLNNRMWRCAGQAFQTCGYITISSKFYDAGYKTRMDKVVLPHELIHMADYYLYGESEKRCGHGMNWMMLMVQYGLEPEPLHTMNITQKGIVK